MTNVSIPARDAPGAGEADTYIRLRMHVGLLAACMILGTSNGLPSTVGLRHSQTAPGLVNARETAGSFVTLAPVSVPPVVTPASARTPARMLADLREASGLTWEQLAKIFGVSRRSIHLWLAGGRMSAANEEKLVRLEAEIAALPGHTPDEKRRQFLASNGMRSRFDDLRYAAASNDRDINRSVEPTITGQ